MFQNRLIEMYMSWLKKKTIISSDVIVECSQKTTIPEKKQRFF